MSLGEAVKPELRRSESERTQSGTPLSEDHGSLFPFTTKEQRELVSNQINSFDYNVLLTPEQEAIEEERSNMKYLQFLESVEFRKTNYQSLIRSTDEIISNLQELTLKYDTVTKETYEFQKESDNLNNESVLFEKLNASLSSNLKVYELLDSITRKLKDPSPNVVKRDSFKRLLVQLDECLEFTKQHKDYKDIDTYEIRFKHCLTRALTLIRNYIINNLKNLKDEINEKLGSTKPGSVTEDALLYTRFGKDAEHLKPLSFELISRVEINDEYQGLLTDCLNLYFGIRLKFLSNKIKDFLAITTKAEKSTLVKFSQSLISFFTKIYHDEFELFFKIFANDYKSSLLNWFQRLSEPLYDSLRNLILRETSISSLCEIATLLEKYYEYEEEGGYDDDTTADSLDQTVEERFNKRINLGVLFQPILQDVQSRLVFRSQVYVDETIVKYQPTSSDFILFKRNKSENSSELKNSNYDGCYTPLSKGIKLLSEIYQLISSSVFDDLAHHIVHVCIVSLKNAYDINSTKTSSTNIMNIDLFYLKNLLILKNAIQNFDIEHVGHETSLDFSGIGDIINKIRNGESMFKDDENLIELVRDSVPKVVNNMLDARQELATELRNTVHKFTEDASKQILEPLTIENTPPLTAGKELQDSIKNYLPKYKSNIESFISDSQVINALIDGIQELVIQNYEQFYLKKVQFDENVEILDVEQIISFIGEISGELYKASQQKEFEESLLAEDDGELLD